MSKSTAELVLDALKPYGLKEEKPGQYRSNRPWSSNSDSMSLTITITDQEHGAYYDHVSGESGSLYELAGRLGIKVNRPNTQKYPASKTKRKYKDLEDYAQEHGVDASIFIEAGWTFVIKQNRPALEFSTISGLRWRFLDGEKSEFKHIWKYVSCWHKLEEAIAIAKRTSQPLVICNGEPSVVVAQHFGIPAFCITGGEKQKIRPDLLKILGDQWSGEIRIAPDCDDTGKSMSQKFSNSLTSAGFQVSVVDLKGGQGFDLADFCKLHQDESSVQLEKLHTVQISSGEETQQSETTDADNLNALLEIAKNSPKSEVSEALNKLAEAASKKDEFTIEQIATQVKALGLANKNTFMKSVKSFQKMTEREMKKDRKNVTPTDDELADSWIQKYPNTAYGLGEFRRYENGIFPVLPLDSAKNEVLQVLEQAKTDEIRPTKSRLESVLELARVQLAIPDDRWDAQIDYLPCKNGVLNIPDLTLLEHDPKYLFTTGLNYDYDPKATCPNFLNVIETVIPDAKDFLQQFAGYALTTDTRYEIAVYLYGPPGSGKSTVITGFQTMLGERAGVLGLADIERSRFALTNLPGKTLVVATEQPAMNFTATHILNALISGEAIEIDRKFKEPFELIPHAKILWSMNELPKIGEAGNGLFRRIKVVSFPSLAEDKRDPSIKEAIKKEGAGILNWALDGLERLKKLGKFELPNCVIDATTNFQADNDESALFITEMGSIGPDFKIQSSLLYQAYKDWCFQNGCKSRSITEMASQWKRLGFEKYLAYGCAWWRGVKLREDPR